MEKFARAIVRKRKLVLLIAVLLLIPAAFGAAGTYINYDILTYLPPGLDSMVGESYLEDDFNMASTAMITVEHMTTADLLSMKEEIAQVPGVESVLWTSDMLDVSIPRQMMPEDIQRFFFNDDGATMMIVKFSDISASTSTMNAPTTLEAIFSWARSPILRKRWQRCCSWALLWIFPSSCCTGMKKRSEQPPRRTRWCGLSSIPSAPLPAAR